MKQTFIAVALGLGMSAFSAFASPCGTAVALTPGGTVVPTNQNTPCGTLVATYSSSGVSTDGSGDAASLKEMVYDYNGTYDFYYQVTNSSGMGDDFETVALRFYGAAGAIDVAYGSGGTLTGGTIEPNTVTATTNEQTVNFNFSPPGAFSPGTTSDWLEVDTSATSYAFTGNVETLDSGSVTISAYDPVAPEPMTMGLLGGGLALLGVARWRRSAKKS